MSATYAVVQTEMKTGNVVRPLPVTGLSFTHTLNAPGAATVGIPLFAPEADSESLVPGVSGLVVLRDGIPVWGGILWTLSADIAAGTLTLNASGFHSHYKARHFASGWSTRLQEQTKLLQNWFAYFNADNGIGTDASQLRRIGLGRFRTAMWTRYELRNAAEAIEELADNIGGFNFRYEAYWKVPDKQIGNRFVIADRSGVKTAHRLTHRANCNVTRVAYDSTALCTQAYAIGADPGNGGKLVAGKVNRSLAERMPERVKVATYSDVKETQTLFDKASATINAGAVPVAIPELTLYPGIFSPAEFIPGEYAAIQVDAGYVALYDEFVVTECATTVDVNGSESISLALASKDVFTNADAS
ncbi:hypothetical protein [Streptomyces sp. NRRL S-920]|uniref:hypothetical protein n=1 Tax=Streptomyces sp. NRRL S-920 TaxID=1463921 RepID=UPI0004C4886B|nr:hypothetical protein [Streptomyces sp. NRRL S-920]